MNQRMFFIALLTSGLLHVLGYAATKQTLSQGMWFRLTGCGA